MLASQTPAHLWMLSGGASRAEESYERCLCSGSEQHTGSGPCSQNIFQSILFSVIVLPNSNEKLKRCFTGIKQQLLGFRAKCRGS